MSKKKLLERFDEIFLGYCQNYLVEKSDCRELLAITGLLFDLGIFDSDCYRKYISKILALFSLPQGSSLDEILSAFLVL